MVPIETHNLLVAKYNDLQNSYAALSAEFDKMKAEKDKVIVEQKAALENFSIRTQNLNSNRNHHKKMSLQRYDEINALKKTLKEEGVTKKVRNQN